jgi:SAM-dependent methyltransferase
MPAGRTSNQRLDKHRDSYDRVAAEYVRHIYHELAGKPFDREILGRFAERLRGRGIVCDMGCGPGHIARYLADRGLDMIGVDLSPGMLEQAVALNPDIPFLVGNMLALDVADEAWAGIAAFYSIIHIPREEVVSALSEMRRVLMPDGLLLLSFHMGEETLHETELWGQEIVLDYWFFTPTEMVNYLEQAGYRVIEVHERDPYAPEVEYQSRRAYILAQKLGH